MSLWSGPIASTRSSKRFLLRLAASVVLLNVIVFTLALLALYQSRARYEERALTAASNIAVFQERDLESIVGQVDLVLLTIADEVAEAESDPLEAEFGLARERAGRGRG